MVSNPFDYGPIPFKVFNSWLKDSEFNSVVEEAFQSFYFSGTPDVILAEKLKWVKKAIKQWVGGKKKLDGERFDKAIEDLNALDGVLEVRPLEEEEEWIKTECLKDLAELETQKTMIFFKSLDIIGRHMVTRIQIFFIELSSIKFLRTKFMAWR